MSDMRSKTLRAYGCIPRSHSLVLLHILSFRSFFYGLRRHDFPLAVDRRYYWSVVFVTACAWRVAPAKQARKADSIAPPARVRNVGRRIPGRRLRESIVNYIFVIPSTHLTRAHSDITRRM